MKDDSDQLLLSNLFHTHPLRCSQRYWNHNKTKQKTNTTGVAACALVFGVLFGVAGLIMTITGANDANIAPAEVLEAERGEVGSPLLDIIGPVFLGVGVAALIAGVSMCMYARYPTRRGLAARAAANRNNAGEVEGS